ncbi:hypothetical protein [Streptomyces sp. NPDC047985]|uniref:hypothetical protein n=1 Tax=Streptomyces sp. NPDC047985 TaxID=3155384 RepID=UPI0034468EF0
MVSRGLHQWEQPTRDQRLARMQARRDARLSATPAKYHAATAENATWSYLSDAPYTVEYCADCGDAECARWMRVQERLDLQSLARMTSRLTKEN